MSDNTNSDGGDPNKALVDPTKDIQDDYEYARGKYYNLAEKGDEAIELMLDLARESEHPRAFEILSNMLKQNAEITDRLMDLQKKKNEVRLSDQSTAPDPASMTQNNVYVGSTTELQRMLAQEKDVTPASSSGDTDGTDDDR
jgi:hypothetical protein